MDELRQLLAKVLKSTRGEGPMPPEAPVERLACGAMPFLLEREADEVYCYGGDHARHDVDLGLLNIGRCPVAAAADVKNRIAEERKRLAGILRTLEREGGEGWEGFDTSSPSVNVAFELMRKFSKGRPPTRGVYLRSKTGGGKTRLFLAAHFDLLAAGVDSRYVTPAELRQAFQKTKEDDPALRFPAEALVANLKRAAVIFFDDVGLAGDERFVGEFRERLKDILDMTGAVFAVSTNLTTAELDKNPDVGPQNLSRLVRGAEVAVMDAKDQRFERVDVRTQRGSAP